MTTPFDTQKVRLDLMQELLQVEQQAIDAPDVATISDLAGVIRWLVGKLAFLESPEYQKRKAMK